MARRLLVSAFTVVATLVAALALSAAGASAAELESPLHLAFQKTCPMLQCTGYLLDEDGGRLPHSSVIAHVTVGKVVGGILPATAVETITYRRSSVTVDWTGIIDFNQLPTLIVMAGPVAGATGHWKGLLGASAHVSAQSVGGVITGLITIPRPEGEDG